MMTARSVLQLSIWIALSVLFSNCSSTRLFRSAEKELLSHRSIKAAHTGISLYDPVDGKFIYDHQGEKYFVPASNTKLATCYAAMKYLVDSLAVFRYEEIGKDSIMIQGMGNPDLLHPDFKDQPALSFLKRYGNIFIIDQHYTDFLGKGWSWDDYQEYYMTSRSELPLYGNIVSFRWKNNRLEVMPDFFRKTGSGSELLSEGFQIINPFQFNRFGIIPGNNTSADIPFTPWMTDIGTMLSDTLKANVEIVYRSIDSNAKYLRSRPVDSILSPMMHRSDNFFAEQMLLMISQEKLGIMNDEKIIDSLLKTDFAELPQKPRWVDGSGLSRYNLFTPRDFVFILDKMQKEFGIDRIKNILPTGGEGTISNYYQEEAGQIFAKTGTLSGAVAFSGYVYTKTGRLLIFSVLVNNNTGPASEVRHAVESFIRRVREMK